MNWHIRKAEPSDLLQLATLSRETFVTAFGPHNTASDMELYLSISMTDEKIGQELNDPASAFYLLFLGQKLAGYAKIRPGVEKQYEFKTPALEVERLYVHQNFQNLQLGEKMLNFIQDHAITQGFRTLWLGVWEHNPGAIRFYERFGMTRFGSHDFLLGKDLQTDILMRKILDPVN
jgi:diamine N-acetyltransferase